jgi:hypothetical protein
MVRSSLPDRLCNGHAPTDLHAIFQLKRTLKFPLLETFQNQAVPRCRNPCLPIDGVTLFRHLLKPIQDTALMDFVSGYLLSNRSALPGLFGSFGAPNASLQSASRTSGRIRLPGPRHQRYMRSPKMRSTAAEANRSSSASLSCLPTPANRRYRMSPVRES